MTQLRANEILKEAIIYLPNGVANGGVSLAKHAADYLWAVYRIEKALALVLAWGWVENKAYHKMR